jgi:hypothetical protein
MTTDKLNPSIRCFLDRETVRKKYEAQNSTVKPEEARSQK